MFRKMRIWWNKFWYPHPHQLDYGQEVEVWWCEELSYIHLELHTRNESNLPTMFGGHKYWKGIIIGFERKREGVEIAWHGCDHQDTLDWHLVRKGSEKLLSEEEMLIYPNSFVRMITKIKLEQRLSYAS